MGKFSFWAAVSALCLLGLAAGASGAQMPDEEVWQQFLGWLAKAPPSDNPRTLLAEYRKHLIAGGTDEPAAVRQINTITALMRTRQDGWQVIFNNIYSSAGTGFSTRPNALLMSAIEGRPAGRALDAGMGQGRNSVFLALKGWTVTGFDVSDAGLAIARKNAEKAGVQITAVQKSEKEFDYGVAQWDLMVFTYVPFAVENADYVQRLKSALRPGGLVVIESFASDTGSAGRRPVDIDPVALRKAFEGFRIEKLDDVTDAPDWTTDKVRLVRMIAEKKR
ncbi:methyltransferase domain-containing protein [Paludibaculum fermentans]|uniref:Methyltransferase domain-containing protein n=1 Tax=Paludibaculum fermentans TaxID=1473598 RepID=A0A7S7NNN0_PALFE|nr:methyltransferase domain-containing protein [Paludibaculum fermentans]QOY86966.1 methyltransferase domain-containing protein [Paludibaculum fermentans]